MILLKLKLFWRNLCAHLSRSRQVERELILSLLRSSERPLFGLEIMCLSRGVLNRLTVYRRLADLEGMGLIQVSLEPNAVNRPRLMYALKEAQ